MTTPSSARCRVVIACAGGFAAASVTLLGDPAGGGSFPHPYDSEPESSGEPPPPHASVAMIELPDGFRAQVFAAEPAVQNPIDMAWDHRGRVWVAENFTYAERTKRFDLELRDRVVVLEDADGDGEAERRTVFSDDLRMLTSVEVGRGGIWVMCPPELLFIPDADGDDRPDAAPQVRLDGFTVARSNYHNFANGLRWGPDGWLYGRCGHSCPARVGAPGAPEAERVPMEGGIWRFHPARGTFEVVCHGTTNPWGHDWDAHGELFFINTVNGHLWHGIPGAHFREHFGASPNPAVYERLEMHADHWHYDTGQHWSKSRGGKANDFGGGHAHIGMMIYQADQWPEAMRGKLYTWNMHGLRANVERLERDGCGYVGRHEDDVFLTSDRWFRGLDLRQGPEGSVYVLDWSDAGECHDHTGVHRSSGRIYRISNGAPPRPDLGVLATPGREAVERCLAHPNVWFERQLRRRLEPGQHSALLREAVTGTGDPVVRLRALWALNQVGAAGRELLTTLLDDPDEHVRAWAVRLLVDHLPIDTIVGPGSRAGAAPLAELGRLVELARGDSSGLVRLTLASALQRLDVAERPALALALAARGEDAGDHNMPSMVWFGLIPVCEHAPDEAANIAVTTGWPQLQRWIARNLAQRGGGAGAGEALGRLLASAARDGALQRPVLLGIADATAGRQQVEPPPGWRELAQAARGRGPETAELVARLALRFGDSSVAGELRRTARDRDAEPAQRRAAIAALAAAGGDGARELCEELLADPRVALAAVRGLAGVDDPAVARRVLERFDHFDPSERGAVVEVLVSRPAWARLLLDAMADGEVPRGELAAFHARQVEAFGDPSLGARLAEVWGEVRDSPAAKRARVAELARALTPERLAAADLGNGRALFDQRCASCHRLYGVGGALGPDLTGSGRHDLGYLLENLVDPSAAVGADYRLSVVTLKDGRVLTGVVESDGERVLTLRQIAAPAAIERTHVQSIEHLPVSMMPEGLLDGLDPQQVRDLIGYLQHHEQVPPPPHR